MLLCFFGTNHVMLPPPIAYPHFTRKPQKIMVWFQTADTPLFHDTELSITKATDQNNFKKPTNTILIGKQWGMYRSYWSRVNYVIFSCPLEYICMKGSKWKNCTDLHCILTKFQKQFNGNTTIVRPFWSEWVSENLRQFQHTDINVNFQYRINVLINC